MTFTDVENSILKEFNKYIELWSTDSTTDALDNRIIAMKMASNIVKEKMLVAKNWVGEINNV